MKRNVILALGLLATAAVLILIVRINGKTVESQTVDARQGQEFFLNTSVGREIIINLEANPTTGYSWREEYDNSRLKLADTEYTTSTNITGLVGNGGIQTYHFKALKSGQTVLTLSYMRPWEEKYIDQKIFNITIN